MKFGVFDHVDANGMKLGALFESRLKLIEQYDRGGFHAYHIAEHHSTPLGYAPSPSVYLAAVAQRTKRLRFGPLVYVTPMYHPLRLVEEIVMLDHMSGGRFELGLGRGASPVELGTYNITIPEAKERHDEVLAIVRQGLTSDVLSHHGKFFRFDRVRIEARPLQQPHPPMWFAVNDPASTKRAVEYDANVVTLVPSPVVKLIADRYRQEWQAAGKPADKMPLIGAMRHLVVADSDQEALDIARPAYHQWRQAMSFLWEWAGLKLTVSSVYPDTFDELQASGHGCAGTPETIRKFIARLIEETGLTYIAADLMFGSMPFAAASHSIDLFNREVIPAFPST